MAFILYLLLFTIYIYTLTPDIFWLDAGEMTCSSYFLGIFHPPGYVIYNILGKLFSFIPLANIAVRVNLLSGVFGVISSLIFYSISKYLTRNSKFLSFILSLIFSFSYTLWFYSTFAEVFTFIYFIYLVSILLILKINEGKDLRFLFLFFLILGIGVTFHPSFLSLIIPFLYLCHKYLNLKRTLTGIFLFLIPVILDIYIPLKSAKGDLLNFGNPQEFVNFLKFKAFLTGVSHPGVVSSFLNLFFQIIVMLRFFYIQIIFPFFILSLFGWLSLLKDREFFLFWNILFFIPTLPFLFLNIEILDIWMLDYFLILSYIAIFIFGIYGVLFFSKFLKKDYILVLILFLAIFQFQRGISLNNRGKYFSARNSLENLLKILDRNALVITENIGIVNLFNYFQKVEKKREDVIFICTEYLNFQWYLKNLEKKIFLPKEVFKNSRDEIIYNDKRDALNAELIFLKNKKRPTYLIFSKEKTQKVFWDFFSKYRQKYVGKIVEFEGEKIFKPFISSVKKIELN